MKKILFLSFLVYSISSYTQICSGSQTLVGQTGVDNFVATYGGTGCTTIDGFLVIRDVGYYGSKVTDLSGLSFLTQINGLLHLQVSDLASLDGLQNIQSIGGSLIIDRMQNSVDNSNLTDISFPALQSVGGDISCYTNHITNIQTISFPALTAVTRAISFKSSFQIPSTNYLKISTSSLTSINFQSLQHINEYFSINNCTNLTDINFTALQDVDSYVSIDNNSALQNLNGLSALSSIGGNFTVSSNSSLQNLNGLSALSSISGHLTVSSNSSLQNINGLSVLSSISDNLTVSSNSSLQNLNGLSALGSVGGSLKITGNDNLTDIGAMSSVSIGTGLFIEDNRKLNDLSAFNGLTSVHGDLVITNNGTYGGGTMTIDNFTSLQSISGFLQLGENANVTNINFPALTTVNQSITISDNAISHSSTNYFKIDDSSTTDIQFPALTTINGEFRISDSALTNMNGFSGLTSVGSLTIVSNDDLTDISTMSNLTNIGTNLAIYGNQKLTNISAFSGLTTINGNLTISNNGTFGGGTYNIDGFTNLQSIGGYLLLDENANVTNINFPALTTVNQSITITDDYIYNPTNNGLLIIDSTTPYIFFMALNAVNGDFHIENAAINNLAGFSAVASIGNDLVIQNNANLTDLNSLSALNSVGGSITIKDNPLLTDISGIANLTTANNITLDTNNLANLTGLQNFTQINELNILNEPTITDLSSVHFSSINTHLKVDACGALTSLNTNTNPASLNGGLIVTNNPVLTDISVLDNTSYVKNDITITGNTQLDECCVLTNFLTGDSYCGGNITINGNNTNCASISVVITGCNVSQNDEDGDGIIDSADNCSSVSNPNQEDTDGDGIGDVCDNCPNVANPLQEDANNNGIGDACENPNTTGTDAGGLGIGTSSEPKSQLEITKGDVFIKNEHRGIIMKSPSGKCFRYQPNEEGLLKAKQITCPDN